MPPTAQVANDNPYAKLIEGFIYQEFPSPAIPKDQLLEALTAAIVSSGQVRYGPAPSPEQLVKLREVLKYHITEGSPIPFLVPFGGRKSDLHAGVDVAELSALKTLTALHSRIKSFYPPGTAMNIRLEDTGALYLFSDEGLASRLSVHWFTETFQKLVSALDLNFINPIAESSLMDEATYFKASQEWAELLYQYLSASSITSTANPLTSPTFAELTARGWKGAIPQEQREYYLSRYRKLYPQADESAQLKRLADYFAGSVVRYNMKGTAAPASPFITVSFVQPVPGAPESLTNARVYYRTLPMSLARTHIPSWRGRGYLKISNDNTVTPKLASFDDLPEGLQLCTVELSGAESAKLEVPYLVE